MNTIRILHTADLHIGAECSYLGTEASKRQYEVLLTMEKIISMCNENAIDLLLIAGDLLDSNHIDSALEEGVFKAFEKLINTRVVIALGNHDPFTADSPFKTRTLNEKVFVLPCEDSVIAFDDLRVRVYGSSFDGVYNSGKNRFELTAPQDDYFNLCLLHGETRSDLNGNYRPITPEYVKNSGMDYIALGHVHTKSQIQFVGTTALAYCGCPEGQGFDESGEKGVYMGEVSKGNINLEFIPTAYRTHIRLDVDITDKEDICEAILCAIKETGDDYGKNYFRITLKGKRKSEAGIDINSLIARISPLVSFVKIKDKTSLGADLLSLAGEKNLKGYFTSIMLSKIESANENEKEKLRHALELGLKAFNEEVAFNED